MVEVVHEDVECDVGDGLHDLAIGQAAYARAREVRVADFAALHDNASRQFQDRVCFRVSGLGVDGIRDLLLGKSDFAAQKNVCAQAVAAQIAFRDRETNLLLDLGTESSMSECGAEIEITLE